MLTIGLLFAGTTLFVNGLSLMERLPGKATVPINALVGSLLLVSVISDLSLFSSPVSTSARLVTAAGYVLFAFTYLQVAAISARDLSDEGLGWYCGWAGLVAAAIAGFNYGNGDTRTAILWTAWTVLFGANFLVSGLGAKSLSNALGLLTVLQSASTATVPAVLMLWGQWDSVPWVAVALVQMIVVMTVFSVEAVHRRHQLKQAPHLSRVN